MYISFSSQNTKNKNSVQFDAYSQKIIKQVRRNSSINRREFSDTIKYFGDKFESEFEKETFNKKSQKLAESLVFLNKQDLAGIIYSFLVKLNKGDYEKLEELATNALSVAIRLNDPIHIMARANDLKEIYKIIAKGSEKHKKVLYKEKRALKEIINNYDFHKKGTNKFSRILKPKENYMAKLAAIKIEIAELIQKDNKKEAINELTKAQEIYKIIGEGENSKKIEQLLNILNNN